jgi:anti-sigma B factor antagonist
LSCAALLKGFAMSLQMITRTFGGVLIVECGGRLVLGEESANLRHLVRDNLSEYKQVVLDLGKVSYMDSSGLGVLVGLYTTAQKVGGGIKLANLSPRLRDMLQITKVFTVFEVWDRAEDAAAAFNPLAGQSTPGEW